jgi:hypothetical protein
MRAAANFHANQARFDLGEERQQLGPSQRANEDELVVLGYPVNLKNILGQIKADCGNLQWVAPPMSRYEHLQYGALRRRLEQKPSTPSTLGTLYPILHSARRSRSVKTNANHLLKLETYQTTAR